MCPSQVAVQRTVLTLGWMTSEGIGLLSHYSAERLYSHQTTELGPDNCSHFTFSSGFFRSLNYIFFKFSEISQIRNKDNSRTEKKTMQEQIKIGEEKAKG